MKWITIASLIITVLGFIATLVFGFLPLIKKVERLEQVLFTINQPTNNSFVEPFDTVSGRTPFLKLNHYILVTALKTGDTWVMDGHVNVSTEGSWTGGAKFGTAGTGSGKFIIQAVATKSVLAPGLLTSVPGDAKYSEPITVTRKE